MKIDPDSPDSPTIAERPTAGQRAHRRVYVLLNTAALLSTTALIAAGPTGKNPFWFAD